MANVGLTVKTLVCCEQESSDGILFFSNDDILQRAKLAKCGGDARKAESAR
jgi:hypothetical protein